MRQLHHQLIALAALLLLPALARAATCTDGTDCLCDRLADSGDPLYNPNVLWCEDFEQLDYYEHTGNDWISVGSGLPNCGLHGVGGNYDRGCRGDWFWTYKKVMHDSAKIAVNAPVSPTLGSTCVKSGYSVCEGLKEYCSSSQGGVNGADCWGPGINSTAEFDVQRTGDTTAASETSTLTGGISDDVGDGKAHMAFRVLAGATSGGMGGGDFTSSTTDFGFIVLLAYNSSIASTGIWADPWKHEEFGGAGDENGDSTQAFYGNAGFGGTCNSQLKPLCGYLFLLTAQQANCASINAAGTITKGTWGCDFDGVSMRFFPSTSDYNQATDWPFGTWGCIRGHLSNIGSSNMSYSMWFNDTLMVQWSGIDGTKFRSNEFDAWYWNAYANANQGGGSGPTTGTAIRYIDDFVVTNGAPPSCADIGFVAGGGGGGEGKMIWRRGARLEWPMPYLTTSYWSRLAAR